MTGSYRGAGAGGGWGFQGGYSCRTGRAIRQAGLWVTAL